MPCVNNNTVFVVIAAYNEAPVIEETVLNVKHYYKNVIVVDDCSTDNTKSKAESAGAFTLSHPINLGQGAALQTGIEAALLFGAQTIVTFDADGQHAAAEISELVNSLYENKVEVALGSRFLGSSLNMPVRKKVVLKAALLFTKITTRLHLTDVHNGFRALSRSFCEKFEFTQNRMAHASEILNFISENDISYIEMPVTIAYTEYSTAKGQKIINSIKILLELLSRRLLK